jgi:hypothetical protein
MGVAYKAVPQDPGIAFTWLLLAKEDGNEHADAALELVGKDLPRNEKLRGQREAAEWAKEHPRQEQRE